MNRENCPVPARAGKPAAGLSLGALGLGAGLLLGTPALASDWYVDGAYGNGNYNAAGTYSQPFKEYWQASQRAQPGDYIFLKPTTTYATIYVTKGGSAGRPITITGTGSSPYLTKVSGFGSGFGVWIGANYVTVSNLDLTAPGLWSGLHAQEGQHHIVVTNNLIHDAGGDGVDFVGDDYLTVNYNIVYGNAKANWNNVYGSGISIKGSKDIDGNTGTKVVINGNKTYANTNVQPWSGASDSDGSGIIIDNNRRTYSDYKAYRGHTLVSNNVSFGNGGRGIHMYLSDNITLNGNTAYHNNQDPHEANYRPGEITGNYVSAVTAVNNILYSDGKWGNNTGQHVPITFMYCYGGGSITVQHNLGYLPGGNSGNLLVAQNNSTAVYSYSNYWGDPGFLNATLDSRYADFRIRSWSPALKNGLNYTGLNSDILGATRYAPTTIGAYENAPY